MQSYEKLNLFEHVYFEDSYVVSIEANETRVEFRLELVLNREHKKYAEPRNGEQYCYAPAILKFENASSINWKRISMNGSIDKDKQIDFGNVDTLLFDADTFLIAGGWGEVVMMNAEVELVFLD